METAVMDMAPLPKFNGDQKEPINVMQELQKQRESLKQNLHEMDKSIKKLTGRDPIQPRRTPVENRRLSTIKRVPLKRESLDSSVDSKPPHKRRWGNTAFSNWNNNELDSGGEEKPMRKPTVQSSVVVTGKPVQTPERRKEDVTMKRRNKRMFGLLLGTLKQFKHDSQMKTETESKQEEKLIQVEEKVQREKEEIIERKKDLIETRHGKKLELEELEFKIAMAELNQELKTHYDQFTDFIQLKSTPCIFYKPAEHNEKTEKLLKESQACFRESFEQRMKEISMCTEEDIQTARVPWDSDQKERASKSKSHRESESRRLFRYGDERKSRTPGKQRERKRTSSRSGKSISDPIVLDHLSSKRDPITVDDDDEERENVTVIVDDNVNSDEEDNEPAKELRSIVVDVDGPDDVDPPEGNEEYSHVDWGKFDDDEDHGHDEDNDDDHNDDDATGKNVRPNFLDLNSEKDRYDSGSRNEDTPTEHRDSGEKICEVNETDGVSENDQSREKEQSSDIDNDNEADGFEELDEHSQGSDYLESHTQSNKDEPDAQAEGLEDTDVLAQRSCESGEDDHVNCHTEDHLERDETESELQDCELAEKGTTGNEHTEIDSRENVPDEKDATNVEHVMEYRGSQQPDDIDDDEIESRNIFTDILPVVNNVDNFTDDFEYADQLLEEVVDKERSFISPTSGVSSSYSVVDERVFQKCNENEPLHHSQDIDARTESDIASNVDPTADEAECNITLFANNEYSSWHQG